MAIILPTPGGDIGTWGHKVNDALTTLETTDKALAASVVAEAQARGTEIFNHATAEAQARGDQIAAEAAARNSALATHTATEAQERTTAIQTAITTEQTARNIALADHAAAEVAARNDAVSTAVRAEASARTSELEAHATAEVAARGAAISNGIAASRPILYGTGFPNGVVAAPVGTLYADTAVTNGASLWQKMSGTWNTGWEVVRGDTGWRDITPADATWLGGTLKCRRTGAGVYLMFDEVRFQPGGGAMTIGGTRLVPVGFRPSSAARDSVGLSNADVVGFTYVSVYATGYIRWVYAVGHIPEKPGEFGVHRTRTAADKPVSGLHVSVTDEIWPVGAMPGTN